VWTPEIKEHLIATGLLRVSVDHTTENELNRPFERYQLLHDTIENLSSNLLGLTVHCARCHDHKFDPIPQANYYRLMAVLKPSFNPEAWIQPQHNHLADVPPKVKEAIDRANAEIDRQVAEFKGQMKTIERGVYDRLCAARLAAMPQMIRSDLKAALAVEPGKRTGVQKYLVDKLGSLVTVTPPETSKALSEDQRQKISTLNQQIGAKNASKR